MKRVPEEWYRIFVWMANNGRFLQVACFMSKDDALGYFQKLNVACYLVQDNEILYWKHMEFRD